MKKFFVTLAMIFALVLLQMLIDYLDPEFSGGFHKASLVEWFGAARIAVEVMVLLYLLRVVFGDRCKQLELGLPSVSEDFLKMLDVALIGVMWGFMLMVFVMVDSSDTVALAIGFLFASGFVACCFLAHLLKTLVDIFKNTVQAVENLGGG